MTEQMKECINACIAVNGNEEFMIEMIPLMLDSKSEVKELLEVLGCDMKGIEEIMNKMHWG